MRLAVGSRGIEVVVDRDNVELLGPAPLLEVVPRRQHEVRGYRRVRAAGLDLGPLIAQAVEVFVGDEPTEVDRVGGVVQVLRVTWWHDLLPRGVVLAPKRGVPRVVEYVETDVASL